MSKGRICPASGLTLRQTAFAEAYARCGIAAQAAREAGYSPKRADQTGHQLLTAPKYAKVQAYIAQLRATAAKQAGVSIKQVIDEFSLIAFADLAEFVEWGPKGVKLRESKALDAARRRAIVEVSEGQFGVKIKLADKNTALDRLGKHLGMFVDKVEHSGEVVTGAPVINLTVTRNG